MLYAMFTEDCPQQALVGNREAASAVAKGFAPSPRRWCSSHDVSAQGGTDWHPVLGQSWRLRRVQCGCPPSLRREKDVDSEWGDVFLCCRCREFLGANRDETQQMETLR